MKLHLPKMLRVVLMGAFVCSASAQESQPMYLNVGMAKNVKVKDNLIECPVNYYTSNTFTNPVLTSDNVLHVGSGDYVGYFSDETPSADNFVTRFALSTSLGNGPISNSLRINGDLEISGSGKVYIGGKSSGNFYSYLEAANVHITSNATGSNEGSTSVQDCNNLNLRADSAKFNSFTMDNGAAILCSYESGGGDMPAGPKIDDSCKSVYIGSLSVNGGYLQMGYKSSSSANLKLVNKMFRTVLNGNVNQKGGTIKSDGKVYLNGSIYQSGGKMTLAYDSAQIERLVLAKDICIEQTDMNNGTKPELTIAGTIAAYSGLNTNTGNGKRKIDIVQTGCGDISLQNGVLFTTKDAASASSITQTGGGAVNLTGDFSSAVFNVNLMKGTLSLTSSSTKLKSSTVTLASGTTLDNNGIFTVGTGAAGSAGVLNVTTGGTLNLVLDGTNAALVTSADTVTGWTMASGSSLGIGFTADYLNSLTADVDDGVKTYDFTQGVLVAQDKNGSVTLSDLQYGTIQGMSSNWTWSTGTALAENTAGDISVTGKLTFNPYVTVDAENDHITYTDDAAGGEVGIAINSSVELAGDNSHTLGTKIAGGNTGITVTLGHANALGAGDVTTDGTTTLTTASKVTADLNVAIKNSGDLTLDGSYDVGTLAANSGVIPAAYVDTVGNATTDGNGFERYEGYTVKVVENGNGATLNKGGKLVLMDGSLTGVLDKDSGVATFGAGVDYDVYRMVEDVEEYAAAINSASKGLLEKVAMSAGTLVVNDSITVETEDTDALKTLKLTGTDVELDGNIGGESTSLEVTGSGIIEGDNSYNGGTVIDGGKLTVASKEALGTGDVVLKNHGTLDLGGKAVSNYINVEGCTLAGAGKYSGNMDVSGDLLLQDATTAAKVVMLGAGKISGAPLTTTALDVQTDGNATVGGDLTINDNGTITLNNGSLLEVGRSLTLGNGTKLVLKGDYAVGTSLLSSTGTLTMGDVSLVYGDSTVELEKQGNSLVLVSKFKQNKATATTLSNWGIATASRAVVNAVRGQRSNTGCIADGKGTAWVASLGSKHEINGSDINISGAAVGADTQVGRDSRIGIALGYVEGEVQPSGLRQVDQEGSYLAVYGEHGLKKLSANSCLSMDWVAAYGTTDSEVGGQKWEQDSVQLNSRVNWNKKVNDKLCMSVFGGLEYFANNSDTVDGVKTGSIQNLRGEIGVGARYVAWGSPAATASYDEKGAMLTEARPGCEKLVLNGEIRYMNDMVRSNPVVRMNGLSGMGDNPGRQGIGIEAGATYRIGERWSASANYGFNTMEDSKEHRLNIGAAYTF